jgi:predicted Ser/Thr protein kinase
LESKPSSTPPPTPVETAPKEDADPFVGTVLLGRVRIVRTLARGGMGKVYYGEQTGLGRACAVKVLDPRLASAEAGDFAKRFLLEASVASKIAHPNVVTVFDYGETADQSCFIAMEYLEGRTLADEIKKGPLDARRAVHIGRQIARALREAHGLGVVHRDVKPGNVFLMQRDEDDDFVKVLDFGLVGEVQDPQDGAPGADVRIMGSPRYMAPEQVQGKASDVRTDVYALGAVIYAMLAGHAPFERATDLATMMAQVSDSPPPLGAQVSGLPGLPAGLEALVLRCLAKDPDDRYATMDALLEGLRPLEDSSTAAGSTRGARPPAVVVQAPPPPSRSPASRPPRRSALTPVTVVAVCAAVIFGLIGASELRRRLGVVDPAPPPAVEATPAAAPPGGVGSAPAFASTPAPAVASATLHVETVPPGAKVKEEGETLCEATPCDLVYMGEAASPKAEHLLVFLKADYKLERKVATVDASPLRVKLTHAK